MLGPLRPQPHLAKSWLRTGTALIPVNVCGADLQTHISAHRGVLAYKSRISHASAEMQNTREHFVLKLIAHSVASINQRLILQQYLGKYNYF